MFGFKGMSPMLTKIRILHDQWSCLQFSSTQNSFTSPCRPLPPPPHSLPYSCRSLAPFPVITSVVPYLFSCYLFGGSNPANRHPLTRESLFGRTTPSTTASNEVKQPAHKMLTNIIPAILSCVHVPPETATFVMKRQKACPTKP